MGPLIYLNDNLKFPLSLGLYAFQTKYETEWNLMMAAALVVTLPLITLFLSHKNNLLRALP
jgi:multiple sugar transport system permease protein